MKLSSKFTYLNNLCNSRNNGIQINEDQLFKTYLKLLEVVDECILDDFDLSGYN